MNCSKCGANATYDAKFCSFCGTTLQPGVQDQTQEGQGVAALVLGIIGLVLCWIPVVGLIIGLVAVILGNNARNRLPAAVRGMATAGFATGIIALVIGSIILVFIILAFTLISSSLSNFPYDFDYNSNYSYASNIISV